ncbi:TPA: hypothetical protein ACGO28_000830 [Streptococcus suis]
MSLKNFCRCLKKVFIYGIAYTPVLAVVSSLISVTFMLPISFFPITKKINFYSFDISLRLIIVECIISLFLSLMGWKLSSKIKSCWKICFYWLLFAASIICFLFWGQILLLQPVIPLLFATIFIERFQKIKIFLQKSKEILAHINVVDCAIIGFLLWSRSFGVLPKWIDWFIFVMLAIVVPILRSMGLKKYIEKYIKSNDLSNSQTNTYFSSYFILAIISFIQIILYLSILLSYFDSGEQSIYNFLTPCIFIASLSVYFWLLLKESVDRGGVAREIEILRWSLGILIIFMILIYDRIEGKFLSVLTWLLPVILPTVIGEIHLHMQSNMHQQIISTIKMKKHLYWLQLVSFLMLSFLSIFSEMFSFQKIEANEIIQINTIKIYIINLLNSTNEKASSDFMSSFTTSFIIVAISFMLSSLLSIGGVKLLKMYYLNPSNGYYQFQNTLSTNIEHNQKINELNNRKYKRNIHKRRT